jgi:hypothetical protein
MLRGFKPLLMMKVENREKYRIIQRTLCYQYSVPDSLEGKVIIAIKFS